MAPLHFLGTDGGDAKAWSACGWLGPVLTGVCALVCHLRGNVPISSAASTAHGPLVFKGFTWSYLT